MNDLTGRIGLYAWGALQYLRLGRPDLTLGFLGGIGDDLLCTAAIEEWLQRGVQRLWFFTRHPALYPHYDRRVRLLPEDARLMRLAERLGRPMRALSYSAYEADADRDTPLREHMLAVMCRRAGLTGRVNLCPRLTLSAEELHSASRWSGAVVVQSAGLVAAVPMLNKQWPSARFQTVADHLCTHGHVCVQVGSAADPALAGAVDLRGRTSLRETAAILAQARLFVGLPGFLMHLARAVDCRGVIIYGGREPPELTGYICNVNLARRPACAPCWQRNRCEHARVCLVDITPDEVIDAITTALATPRAPLAVETCML